MSQVATCYARIAYMARLPPDEAQFLAELMSFKEKTPQDILREEMAKRGVRKVDLGNLLGLKEPGRVGSEILDPKQPQRFGPRRQEKLAELWDLPKDHFRRGSRLLALEAYRHRMWAKFLTSRAAKSVNTEEKRLVRWVCMNIPLSEPYVGPTFLEAVALALTESNRYTPEELVFAADENAELDSMLADDEATPTNGAAKTSRETHVDGQAKDRPKTLGTKRKPSKRK